MITEKTLTILQEKRSEITANLREFGEENIRFYDALDGILGVISRYNSTIDTQDDFEGAKNYLLQILELEETDLQFEQETSSVLTHRMIEECVSYDEENLGKIEILLREIINNQKLECSSATISTSPPDEENPAPEIFEDTSESENTTSSSSIITKIIETAEEPEETNDKRVRNISTSSTPSPTTSPEPKLARSGSTPTKEGQNSEITL